MKLLLAVLFLSFSPLLFSKDKATSEQAKKRLVYYYFDYTVSKRDTFSLIIKKFVKPTSIISAKTPMVLKTRINNPQIKNWANLREGEKFRLYVRSDLLDKKRVAAFYRDRNDNKERADKWNYSLFYALSRGSLQESVPDSNITTESSQDSPLTLGFSVLKKLSYDFNYSGSLYLSKLDGGLSDQNESVSLPWEYGLNSYVGYQRENWPLEVYTGFDHERFSSYNTEELPSGEPLETREHTLTFLTLGVSKKFEWFGEQFLAKASYSSSVMSSQSRSSKINPQEFEGTKFILYLNMKASKDWFYHGFYKQHDLEGATALQISRVGLGFGHTL